MPRLLEGLITFDFSAFESHFQVLLLFLQVLFLVQKSFALK